MLPVALYVHSVSSSRELEVKHDLMFSGNCLGGGSSINTMMGSRPTVAGMDAIAALGNPGWGWDDFLPSVTTFLVNIALYGLLSAGSWKGQRRSPRPMRHRSQMGPISTLRSMASLGL